MNNEIINTANLVPTTTLSDLTDEKVAILWLNARAHRSQATFISYEKIIKRFFQWLFANELSVASVNVVIATKYLMELSMPSQYPFMPEKPMSAKSINHTRTVLSNFYSYAVKLEYCPSNPIFLTRIEKVVKTTTIEKYFEIDSWRWIKTWLDKQDYLPDCVENKKLIYARNRFLIYLLYHTGMRRAEVANAKLRDFSRRGGVNRLKVIGKGTKERFVTLNNEVVSEFYRYLKSKYIELPCDEITGNFALIMPIHGAPHKNMTTRSINRLLNEIRDSILYSCEDPIIKQDLSQLTTHWFRHTNATHRIAKGASILTTQEELGHQNINTTRLYTAVLTDERIRDADLLSE